MKRIITNTLLILKRKERYGLLRLICFDLLVNILDIIFLAALIFIINFYTQKGQSPPFLFTSFPFLVQYPLSLIIVFFILYGIKNGLAYIVFKKQYHFVYTVAARLSKKNLLSFLQGHYTDYVGNNSSSYIRSISHQPIEFGHHVLGGIQQITGQVILVIITTIAIFLFNPFLCLLLIIILAPSMIIISYLIKKRLAVIRKTAKPVSEKALQHLQEALSGFVESNTYEKNSFFINRYSTYQKRFNNFLSQQLVVQNLPFRLMEIFAVFGILLLIGVNYYTDNAANLQLVTIGAFMAAAYRIIPGIVKIMNSTGQLKTYEYTLKDLLANVDIKKNSHPNKADEIKSIAFENVSFAYKEETVVNNFSMYACVGDFIGLSGISGKGKTTIINLLLGFVDQQSGNIFINNGTAGKNERERYRNDIAYVKQSPFLIHDTLLNNITLEDNCSDPQKAKKIIEEMELDIFPENADKIITEHGRNISGGQRQRIAVARALYKDANVIILDEPFSELNSMAEKRLLTHFQSLAAAGKIIILISHNKESLSFCNKTILLNEN